jgi:hypothetical protein
MSESDQSGIEKQHSETLNYSITQFDKNILFIASGALGISFAFIKDIVPNLNESIYKAFLFTSWYLFATVIFLSLLGHYLSMRAHTWAVNNPHVDDETFNNEVIKKNKPIRRLNILMIIANFIGALSLILFIHLNLFAMSDDKKQPPKDSSPKSTPKPDNKPSGGIGSIQGYGDSQAKIDLNRGAEVKLRPTTPPKPKESDES